MNAKALYDTNSATINAALKALSNAAATGLGRNVEDWMGQTTTLILHDNMKADSTFRDD
jgi:hypothetical protein